MSDKNAKRNRSGKLKGDNEYTKSELMIMILLEIARNANVDKKSIMKKFNLDRLKYSRYMRDLSRIVPIFYDNKAKRYDLNVLDSSNRILKSPPEFYAFMLMLQGMAKAFEGRQNQVSNLLSKYHIISDSMKKNADSCFQFIESGKSAEHLPENIYGIYRAILAGNTIEFDYNAMEKEIRPQVDPYKIIFDRHWYLYGYSHYSKGNRLYKINRISHIAETGKRFNLPESLPPINSVSNSWDFQADPENPRSPIEVKIEFASRMKRMLTEEFFHHSQKIEELPDGRFLFTVKVMNTSKLIKWVLGFENNARIISPDSVISEMKKKLDEICGFYEKVID